MDLKYPAAEVQVDVGLVQSLLREQHPTLATASVSLIDEGWDNYTYRVGSFGVRLPRRETAVQLILNEQRWLPVVARWLEVAVPVPVGIGIPSDLFRWPWSVVEWIEGKTADEEPLAPTEAESLARMLRSLHRAAPPDAPSNPFRGVALSSRKDVVEERLDRLGLRELVPLWRGAIVSAAASAVVWIHGDLHPRNIVTRNGALAGIIDWGDLTAGDVAADLASAWMLLDRRGRSAFWEAYQPTDDERSRALGWAVNLASAMVDSQEPKHVRIGRQIVEQLTASD